ncbi:hypothetical protein [Mesorhizobium sp. CA7]|nr:hypothetical protein [Mesorhizobium sp. CA7]MBZ9816923.1 hypothetical protein [Mesorhizobium sp. CA7]
MELRRGGHVQELLRLSLPATNAAQRFDVEIAAEAFDGRTVAPNEQL